VCGHWLLLLLGAGMVPLTPDIAGAMQDSASLKNFGVSLAATSLQLREQVLNPLRHDGVLASLAVFHHARGTRLQRHVELQLAFNTLTSRFESDPTSFALDTRLSYSYTRYAAAPFAEARLFVGGVVAAGTTIALFDSWDDSHVYWHTAYTLGPTASLETTIAARTRVTFDAALPLLSLVSRPRSPILRKADNPDFGKVMSQLHENMRLTSVHEHLAPELTLQLVREKSRLGRNIFWRLNYLRSAMPYSEPVTKLRYTFGASAVF
jgi:hypothetical protein